MNCLGSRAKRSDGMAGSFLADAPKLRKTSVIPVSCDEPIERVLGERETRMMPV